MASAEKIENEKINNIISGIKTDGGAFVYNPNGFTVCGTASLDGKSVYVEDIPPFGYKVVKGYKDTNNICFFENGMENDFYRLTFGKSFKRAYLCDLMENEIKELPIEDNSVELGISGFEIVTLKLKQ